MTFQQILQRVAELYPHGEQASTIINHINSAQDDLSAYFGKTIVDTSLSTTADTDEYAFPSGVSDCSEIKILEVGSSSTPTDRFDYTAYKFHEIESGRPSGNCYYQIYSSSGAKSIGIYPIPAETGIPIRITYNKSLDSASVSALTESPEFDERYHDLLVYYACYMICSSGASPDAVQANAFFQKYKDGVEELWRLKNNKEIRTPLKRKYNSTWDR